MTRREELRTHTGAAARQGQLQEHLLGAPVAAQPLDDRRTRRGVHIEVGHRPADDLLGELRRDQIGGTAIQGDDRVIRQPADDGRKRAGVEKVPIPSLGRIHGVHPRIGL
jgi:hypothetical protein